MIIGLARPALRLERPRGAARDDAQRRLRARLERGARLARARQARRRDRPRRPGRAHPLPLRAQPGRRGARGRRARRGCGRTRRGGCGRDRGGGAARPAGRARRRSRRASTGSRGRRSSPPPRRGSARRPRAAGLRVERDPAGSLWALPGGDGPWWATGSHLDSVRRGGRFDGPLGVAAGFAVAERLPGVAVIAFADEEGARFNTPTFGSRALTGRLDVADVLARRDDDGVALAEAMRAAGADPEGLADAPAWLRAAARLPRAAHRPDARPGAARRARRRGARARLADAARAHASPAAPTTRARRAATSAATRSPPPRGSIVAADELAGGDPDFLVTAARMLVEPNAFTTVPSGVRLWIDGRTPDPARLAAWRDALTARAAELAGATGVGIDVATASHTDGVEFARRRRVRRPARARLLRRPRRGHPRCEDARRHGLRAQPDRREPRARGGRVARRRRRRGDRAAGAPWSGSHEHRSSCRRWSTRTRTRSSATCAARRSGPAPEAHAADDFWSWREAMYRLAGEHDPGSMRIAAGRVYAEMAAAGYGAVGEFHYVHHRPDGDPVPGPERDGDRGRRGGRRRRAADRPPPRRLSPRRLEPPADAGPAPLLRPGRRRATSPASTRCARGRTGAPGVGVGVAAHSVRAVPAAWLEAIAAYADQHGLVRHVHAHEQPRELEECREEHGVSPIELLAPDRLPRPAHEPDPRHPRDRGGRRPARGERHDRRLLPDDRGQPRRRPLPGARLPRRRRPDRDRQRLERPRRPVRGDARARDARAARAPDPPRAAGDVRRPVGRARRERPREPRPARAPAPCAIDRDHPDLAGVAAADLPLAVATCGSAAVVATRAAP